MRKIYICMAAVLSATACHQAAAQGTVTVLQGTGSTALSGSVPNLIGSSAGCTITYTMQLTNSSIYIGNGGGLSTWQDLYAAAPSAAPAGFTGSVQGTGIYSRSCGTYAGGTTFTLSGLWDLYYTGSSAYYFDLSIYELLGDAGNVGIFVSGSNVAVNSGGVSGTSNISFGATVAMTALTLSASGGGSTQSPLQITTASPLPAGTVGVPYVPVQLTATGGTGSYTWTVTDGTLPNGLFLSTEGLITGNPQMPIQQFFTVQVADTKGATASQVFGLQVNAAPSSCSPLKITSSSNLGTYISPSGVTIKLTAQCGSPPYYWSFDRLPQGLNMGQDCAGSAVATTCTLTGQAVAGSNGGLMQWLTIQVTDSSDPPQTFAQNNGYYAIQTASEAHAGPLEALAPEPQVVYMGRSYQYDFDDAISGGACPCNSQLTPPTQKLPTGLSLSGMILSGTPSVSGPYTITTTVTDQNGNSVLVTLSVTSQAVQTAPASGTPVISFGGVVDAAAEMPVLTPGGVFTIYGSNLASSTVQSTTTPLPTTSAGVQVTVDGENATFDYVSPSQANVVAPSNEAIYGATRALTLGEAPRTTAAPPTMATVIVYRNGVPSAPVTVPVSASSPTVSLYYRTSTVIDPVILRNTTNSLVTPQNPAVPGDVLIAYGTGVGLTNCYQPTGGPSGVGCIPQTLPQLTFPDYPTLPPVTWLYAGLSPGGIGLAQYNIQLPSVLPSAAMTAGTIRMRIGDPTTGQTFKLYIANQLTKATTMTLNSSEVASAFASSLCSTPTAAGVFSETASEVGVWLTFSNALAGDVLQFQWINPSGTNEVTGSTTISFNGGGCASDSLDIAGYRPSTEPGTWTVQVLVNGGWLLSLPFVIAP